MRSAHSGQLAIGGGPRPVSIVGRVALEREAIADRMKANVIASTAIPGSRVVDLRRGRRRVAGNTHWGRNFPEKVTEKFRENGNWEREWKEEGEVVGESAMALALPRAEFVNVNMLLLFANCQ